MYNKFMHALNKAGCDHEKIVYIDMEGQDIIIGGILRDRVEIG